MLSPREGVKSCCLGGTQDFCNVPGVTDVWQILQLQNSKCFSNNSQPLLQRADW